MRNTALHYPNILFDLDGTLINSREDTTHLVQSVLTRLGIDEPNLARLKHSTGPPLLQCFMQIYGFDEARAWEAVNHYHERFRITGLYENHVLDGIPKLLKAPVGRSHTLYVVTSKPGVFTREAARHFAFDCHFKAIYGNELDGTCMHRDELIRHLFDSEDPIAEHCLMIGGHMRDLLGASRNGVAHIDVGYGFGSEGKLRVHQSTHYRVDLATLRQVLESC